MRELSKKIRELRKERNTYDEIAEKCECSIYLVRKELGTSKKEKTRKKRDVSGSPSGRLPAPPRARNSGDQAKKRAKKGKKAKKKGVVAKKKARTTAQGRRASKQKAFLKTYKQFALVIDACDATGVSTSTVHRWRKDDPEGFGKDYNEASEIINDRIDDAFVRRGVFGVKVRKFDKGQPVMIEKWDENDEIVKGKDNKPVMVPVFETVYSDTCLVVAAKARMPDKYADRSKAEVQNKHSLDGEMRKTIAEMTAPERECRLTELLDNIKKVGG